VHLAPVESDAVHFGLEQGGKACGIAFVPALEQHPVELLGSGGVFVAARHPKD
jgi:hypothetical protein